MIYPKFQAHACMRLSGKVIPLSFRFRETEAFFRQFIIDSPEIIPGVFVPEVEWQSWLSEGGSNNAQGEYSCMTAAVSDFLLRESRCIIHAGAFRYQGKAWLIVAPSGTGKSTQIKHLQDISINDFGVICGDRPVLELKDDGTVFVHPSPWNGKENWKGAEGGSLAGIILLERSMKNSFTRISAKDAVFPVLCSLINTGETEETIRLAALFEDALLSRVEIYQLTSYEAPDSTRLMYDALFKETDL